MILDQLADYARLRVANAKAECPLSAIKAQAEALPKGTFRFEVALRQSGLSTICEVKKASPSKGIIAEDFPYVDIAKAYEAAGATCVSVLTEPKWFMGSDQIFREIRAAIDLPMLRKDFTVDAYQIYEAHTLGADAVLLIVALLDADTLSQYLDLCDTLGLSAVVEAHDADEIKRAADCGARIIGVNNRNLKDFTINMDNAIALRQCIPENVLYIAESGVKAPTDVAPFAAIGADAVLIGEALMRTDNPAAFLSDLAIAAKEAHEQN